MWILNLNNYTAKQYHDEYLCDLLLTYEQGPSRPSIPHQLIEGIRCRDNVDSLGNYQFPDGSKL
jgi:hypothetical protein